MISAAERECTSRNPSKAYKTYHLYGSRLQSQWPLPYSTASCVPLAEILLVNGSDRGFDEACHEAAHSSIRVGWFRRAQLRDGAVYLRWGDLFEFVVSADGRRITGRPLARNSLEVFHTYLLGQALSFALIHQGLDPLHATTVTVDGQAVAFLGNCGLGKSSLAAAFLAAGHRMLTDDLLVLSGVGGDFVAYPGAPRIKVFPEIAELFLGGRTGSPLTRLTPKLIIPLDEREAASAPVRLKAIYMLAEGSRRPTITIRRLSRRRACVELLRNTFNAAVTDPRRLHRQFALATGVAAAVPVKVLSYPRVLDVLPSVRQAILADLITKVRRAGPHSSV